jgi:hypothetical protein
MADPCFAWATCFFLLPWSVMTVRLSLVNMGWSPCPTDFDLVLLGSVFTSSSMLAYRAFHLGIVESTLSNWRYRKAARKLRTAS